MTLEQTGGLAARIRQIHPGLAEYTQAISGFFHLPLETVQERFWTGIMRLDTSKAVEACREWERVGILPDVCCESDDQLRALWKSPLFEIILANVLDFYPPASTNITNHIPTACNNIFGYALREFPLLSNTPYWQYVLFNSLPELYLDPFLPQNPGAKIIGCDLACGWGRACLSLRNY